VEGSTFFSTLAREFELAQILGEGVFMKASDIFDGVSNTSSLELTYVLTCVHPKSGDDERRRLT